MNEALEKYQKAVKINRLIEENETFRKIVMFMFKVMCWKVLQLKHVRKEHRSEFIINTLKMYEYELREECGYKLTDEQEKHLKAWKTIVLLQARLGDLK